MIGDKVLHFVGVYANFKAEVMELIVFESYHTLPCSFPAMVFIKRYDAGEIPSNIEICF